MHEAPAFKPERLFTLYASNILNEVLVPFAPGILPGANSNSTQILQQKTNYTRPRRISVSTTLFTALR